MEGNPPEWTGRWYVNIEIVQPGDHAVAANCIGIIVGGGPAPGINGVIGAATINAINHGFIVKGIYDGFKALADDHFDPDIEAVELEIPDVARIHFDGGSVLRTSRTSLLDTELLRSTRRAEPDHNKVAKVLAHLRGMGVTHLVTIGGDDTALSARYLVQAAGGELPVVHVPKTIDNDLPLPGGLPTFGFNTARHYGAELVANLMEDSRTTVRWYFVVTMGRSAGFLAMEIAKAAGATMSLIPEELPDKTSVAHLVSILEGAIFKRRAMGRRDGVAVIAEGVAYKLGDRPELEHLLGKKLSLDAFGHVRLSGIQLEQILKKEVERRFRERGDSISVVAETIGYELRCARPTPFDMAYCRDLGHGAISLLVNGDAKHGLMVTIESGDLKPIRFDQMIDPDTNRTHVRRVDLNATSYQVARSYMIRLEPEDFASDAAIETLAAQAKMSPADFAQRYRRVVDESMVTPPPSLARSQVVCVVDDPIQAHRGKVSRPLPG